MESIEDEWERMLESDDDLDLLFVRYDPRKVSLKAMQKTIRDYGDYKFNAQVR